MATYTREQLRTFNTNSADFSATTYTFTLNNNISTTAGFAIEGVNKDIFSSASISNTLGCTFVSSSTNAAFLIDPNTTARFDFTPTSILGKNLVKFSAPNVLSYNINDLTASGSVFGVDLTIPSSLPYTPPLDNFDNVEVGYSVRKISSLYTGKCLEAYRTSDGATQDIGFDANGLISEDELADFYDGSVIRVSKWYDQSGANNDMIQALEANMPRIYGDQTSEWSTGGVGVFRLKYGSPNNPPINESFALFNLLGGSQTRMDLTNPITTGPTFSVAAVSNGSTTSSNVWGNTGSGQTWLARILGDRYNSGGGTFTYPTPTANAQNSLFVNDASTPVVQVRVNGMEDESSITPKTSGAIPNFHIWDSQFVGQQNASISEIILFNDSKWSNRVALTTQQGDYFQI